MITPCLTLAGPTKGSHLTPAEVSRARGQPVVCASSRARPEQPASASRFSMPIVRHAFRQPRPFGLLVWRDELDASTAAISHGMASAHRSFAPTRSAQTPHVATASGHRVETDDASTISPLEPRLLRGLTRSTGSGSTDVPLARAARGVLSALPPFDGLEREAPRPETHAMTIHSRGSHVTARYGRGAGRSRDTAALDRGPLHPHLREDLRDRLHPRCLPSMRHPRRHAPLGFPWDCEACALRQALARRLDSGGALSTACHQPVDRAQRPFRLRFDADLDGPTTAKTCSLLRWSGPKPFPSRRGPQVSQRPPRRYVAPELSSGSKRPA